MEIALRVVQFWSIFVITRLISDEIALHSVQLPLYAGAHIPKEIEGVYYDWDRLLYSMIFVRKANYFKVYMIEWTGVSKAIALTRLTM